MLRLRSILRLALVFGAGCAVEPELKPQGGLCAVAFECAEALTCYRGYCEPRQEAGGWCDPRKQGNDRHCAYGLECATDNICRTSEDIKLRAVLAEHARESDMLHKSGVEAPPMLAERAAPPPAQAPAPPAPGVAVRVVEITSEGSALAACRPEERLVGGGCFSKTQLEATYPSHHSPEDTVGARWNCSAAFSNVEVTAYALCEAVPTP